MSATNSNFYSNLKVQDTSISTLLAKKENFCDIPGDWHVLVADIRNSTQAVKKGNHNHVNLVATGCVVAVLNLAESHNINIPFFFGGDGATFLIPEMILEDSIAVLQKHNKNTQKNFGFSLAIGSYRVDDIYKEKINLKIARVKANDVLNIPVILGKGLQYAEEKIKGNPQLREIKTDAPALNLTGMECKWDRIKPPNKGHEVISLIIAGCGDTDFSKTYSRIMASIDEIYGPIGKRKPISVKRLKIKTGLQRVRDEMKTKFGKWNIPAFIKGIMISNFGEFYLKNTNAGKGYLQKLVELSDNLSLDGRINTVITGNSKQRKKLIAYLDNLEETGRIKYGHHVSAESIMSCYVKDVNRDQHIHFIDGGDGGYTKAANQLKLKFQDGLP